MALPGMRTVAYLPGDPLKPGADVDAQMFPFIERIFADGGYQGAATAAAVRALGPWHIEIIKRADLHRFVVLPKRWIVERTFAWMGRNRRLSKDYENTTRFATAYLRLAMIRLMLRRLIRGKLSST